MNDYCDYEQYPAIQRIPPQAVESEAQVLGTMLLKPNLIPLIETEVEADDFYREAHRMIYAAIVEGYADGGNIDMLILMQRLMTISALEKVGGATYLATLTEIIPSSASITAHCRIVRDKAHARRLITIATDAVDKCYNGEAAGDVSLELSDGILKNSTEEDTGRADMEAITDGLAKTIELRQAGDPSIYGIKTGLLDVDDLLWGLQKTDLIILAARPSMGKTTLAMNVVTTVAMHGARCLVFSLEMSKEKLVEKIVSSISRVNYKSIQRGMLNVDTLDRVQRAMKMVRDLPINIDDSSGLHIRQIKARAKMAAMRDGVDLIVVDYLQLARGDNSNRTIEVGEISRGLKAIAKDLKVPVLALAQLNRGLESRTDKRPLMSDLRDSGEIEQDADVIAFIYRDEVYNRNDDNPAKGKAEILIRKNRCGETGMAMLHFSGHICSFENLHYGKEETQ